MIVNYTSQLECEESVRWVLKDYRDTVKSKITKYGNTEPIVEIFLKYGNLNLLSVIKDIEGVNNVIPVQYRGNYEVQYKSRRSDSDYRDPGRSGKRGTPVEDPTIGTGSIWSYGRGRAPHQSHEGMDAVFRQFQCGLSGVHGVCAHPVERAGVGGRGIPV